MIIVMFLHFVSDLALLCRRSTKDLPAKGASIQYMSSVYVILRRYPRQRLRTYELGNYVFRQMYFSPQPSIL